VAVNLSDAVQRTSIGDIAGARLIFGTARPALDPVTGSTAGPTPGVTVDPVTIEIPPYGLGVWELQ
jgi:hypothetical protein